MHNYVLLFNYIYMYNGKPISKYVYFFQTNPRGYTLHNFTLQTLQSQGSGILFKPITDGAVVTL